MNGRTTNSETFEYWLFDMDRALESFVTSMQENEGVDLDFTEASLSLLESWLLMHFPDVESANPLSEAGVLDGAARYVGETFRKNLGGKWLIDSEDSKNAFFGLPQISGMAGQTTQICPLTLVTASLDRRSGFFLRNIYENNARR